MSRPPARALGSAIEANDYYFGAAEDAADAASAAALAAAAESAAAEAAASGAGVVAGGGVVSVVGAGASVLLPQALRTNAAARALKASLVFIYRYPRNFKNVLGKHVVVGFHPDVRGDFRVFRLNFISLSPFMERL